MTVTSTKSWVCFKAKNGRGVYGYASLQADLTTPALPLLQDNDKIKADMTDSLSDTIVESRYFTKATDPTCDSSASWSSATTNWITGTMTHGHYACFRFQNELGIYGYTKLRADLTTPVLSFSINHNIVSVTTSNLTDYHYFLASSSPTCASTITTGWLPTTTKSAAVTSSKPWICFRVKNNKGVYGYGKTKVSLLSPTITLTQTTIYSVINNKPVDNTYIAASGTGLSGYQYFKTYRQTPPTCDSNGTYNNTGSVASNLLNNQWVCFRAKNSSNVYGYGKLQVDLNPPVVTITQTSDVLTATTTATDLPATPLWQHSSQSDPGCSSSWINGQTAQHITYSQYYCFKVKDKLGNIGYGSTLAVQPAPTLYTRQSNVKVKAAVKRQTPNLQALDQFGYSSSLDGDYLAVGVYLDGGHSGTNTGAVYVFKRTGTTWALEQEISDQSSGFTALRADDRFWP